MKKHVTLSPLITVVFSLLTLAVMAASKDFEGVVTYKISYPNSEFSESQLAMFPKIMTVMIKGDKTRQELNTQMGSQIEITDYTAQSKTLLLNMMGQKFAIQQSIEDIKKEMQDEPVGEVVFSDETKTIAGYTCKKAVVTVNVDGTKTTLEAWYTDEFGQQNVNFDNPTFQKIPGVMLEFTMNTPQFMMKFTAISIEKQKLSPKEFEIPADYTPTTMEELQSKMGGGM